MNRESFRYFERYHLFLDVIQRVGFPRFGARSECFEETRGRLQAILMRIFREFRSLAEAPKATWYGGDAHGYSDWPGMMGPVELRH